MIKILCISALYFLCTSTNAQSLLVKDLSISVGTWEGKLTYLDYTSGKPYTMSVNIQIGLTADKKGYVMGYEYPTEPHANSKDTTYIIDKKFGNDSVVEFLKYPDEGYKMITEVEGKDGNDDKKAILRHIYDLKPNTYTITKEVKFVGTDVWIKRNQYVFKRLNKQTIKSLKSNINHTCLFAI